MDDACIRRLIDGYCEELRTGARQTPCADELCRNLSPRILRIAQTVTRGQGPERHDFIDEAPGFVLGPREGRLPRIARFDPERGALEAFLFTMLQRAWCSRLRLRSAHIPLRDGVVNGHDQHDPEFLSIPFTETDLHIMLGWEITDRILLLCLTALWPKVPENVWRQWTTERHLPGPFPGTDFLQADNSRAWLANALGMTLQRLYSRTHRRQHLLREVPSLVEEFGSALDPPVPEATAGRHRRI